MKKYFCIAIAFAFLACSNKDNVAFTEMQNKSLNIEKIIILGETILPPASQDENANITFTHEYTYHGYAGCNRFFGSFSLKDNKIIFAQNGGATRMLCPPEAMRFEDALLTHLLGAGEFTLAKEGDSFVLHSNEVKIYLR